MTRARFQTSSCVFVILRQKDQMCFIRRASTGWMDGHFSLPAGGVEPGETLRQAASREAFEEIGVRIAPEHLTLVHTLYAFTDGDHWTGHFFEARIWEGVPEVKEPHKHSEWLWSTLEGLQGPVVPYVQQVLFRLRQQEVLTEYGF